jgi:hypothetical protein
MLELPEKNKNLDLENKINFIQLINHFSGKMNYTSNKNAFPSLYYKNLTR